MDDQPSATSFDLLHSFKVGKVGVEPTISCFRRTQGAVPLHPEVFLPSMRPPLHGLLPTAYRLLLTDPCGIRTRPAQLERLMTSPEVERAAFTQARTASAVGREALESSSPGFQPSAIPSQLPTQCHFVCRIALPPHCVPSATKKPAVLVTPGFSKPVVRLHGRASQAQWLRGPIPRQRQLCYLGNAGSQCGITRTLAFLDRTRA